MIGYLKNFHRIVWIQVGGHAITSFVSIILLPFLTLYMYEQFGENIMIVTLVIGIQPFTEILFTFLLGGWIDRIGRRPIMLGSLAFQIIAIGGFAFATHTWLYVLFSFLNGIGRFVYIPAARAQIADIIPASKQAETFAILSTASSIGALGGPIVGAVLFQFNQEFLFLMMASLILVYLLIAIAFLPESIPTTMEKTRDYKVKLKNNKLLVWFAVGMLPLSFFHAQMETNWPVYLKENLVNYLFVFSLLETIGTIVFILFEVYLINRTAGFSSAFMVQVGYGLYAVAAIGFGVFHNIVGLIVSQVLFCMGSIMVLNHMQSLVSNIAPVNHKGRYFALFGLHWDISRSVGPLLGSGILSALGGRNLFFVVFLLVVLGFFSQTRAFTSISEKQSILLEKSSKST
ncbi:MFS transporter [Pontibacillus yanchengensis]|uniref:MFS transporter n=1 Tax=Pontibacillus yanchengensis TaxID=462910 RepID=A0A6I4ZXC8_9BACI|nr:MFS transporter [Pontibacillus yanchengensis]MYL32610.1 MFS transporter [Pontibacillus yanchengensis]